eukprot:TRINITY_DN4626_c0_g1::TRINITY_DN4626_c0_g1_i1::g.19620::m.19620 TRINITY_DN4626_c0_g1::TRINITY_DN4626_c0_g1_i1::g.19620  ORF type:complete len:254 (+),score=-16.77,sp/Q9M2U3/ALPL_ARATH/31.40/2e-12,DDE_Tnp_4/PF13359.1/2.2e-26,DDE_Tnp_1/PF01609.16/6.7e-05,DDE_Tnp_1/PF01609.16/26,Plant_tran/PF04827.9/0.00011,DDE_Tnp_1_2/PF13586.1/0.0045 TRINITY_DN4626_c0_g1_i1:600-1361(+)
MISQQFGAGESTICSWTEPICLAILDAFPLRIPPVGSQERQHLCQAFEEAFESKSRSCRGLSRCCVGIVDGKHVYTKRPWGITAEQAIGFIGRKMRSCILMQAVVDLKFRFLDVLVGWPGSVHDSRMYKNSKLFLHRTHLFSDGTYIIGDSGYPNLPAHHALFRPSSVGGDPVKRHYNRVISSIRVSVERAFGLLTCRFRSIRKDVECRYETTNLLVSAAVVIHKRCSDFNDSPPIDNDIDSSVSDSDSSSSG